MITPQSLLVLILTEKCNLTCAYCLRDAGVKEKEIDYAELKRIVLKAHSLGYQRMGLTGGEALLYSHFRELMELLGALGFWVFLETNGYLLNEEIMHVLKSHMGDNLEFLTSLDSPEETINDRLRGKGAYQQALKTITLIKGSGYKVSVNTIVTQYNLNSVKAVEEHIQFTRGLEADYLYLSAAVPLGRGREQAFFIPPRQRMLIRKVLEKNDFYNGYVVGHCAHYASETIRNCTRLSQRHHALSPHGIHPCVYQEGIKIGELSDFDDCMSDGRLMESFSDLRRAALADYPSRFLDCHECMQSMKQYLEKISAIIQQSTP
jgi:MoaA/NifB/PqqE/SkfB family radical SAM enzyme